MAPKRKRHQLGESTLNERLDEVSFLGKYNDPDADCPFGCGQKHYGEDLLEHVFTSKNQSDDHLLAAARVGLFETNFSPQNGVAQRVDDVDPEFVPLECRQNPRNINLPEGVKPAPRITRPTDPVLHLPTVRPMIETAWWPRDEEGIHGYAEDPVLRANTKFMHDIDRMIRSLNHGQADEHGNTRDQSFDNVRREEAVVHLRKRLRDLRWAWPEGDGSG